MTMDEKICKNCIHYQMCVDTFRKAKQDGEVLLIKEEEYFANANGCDFYADKRIYRKQIEGKWVRYPHNSGIYCSICRHKRRYKDINDAYCPNCGARMDEKEQKQ